MAGEVSFVSLALIGVLATFTAIFVSLLIIFTFRHRHHLFGPASLRPDDIESQPKTIHGVVEGKTGGDGEKCTSASCLTGIHAGGRQTPDSKQRSPFEVDETVMISGHRWQNLEGSEAGGGRWDWTAALLWWAAEKDYVISA
ncbi:hypothetical protein HPP92_007295 [Vanilla planifolia]|uniref:Uncharacterized protein n=1 Tax=Vanilla planifolia TaxID=51239 RepID=A0A835V5R4_VANPL|nr:hypothetical protein HPP92_007295 [Vanilla planifolia]